MAGAVNGEMLSFDKMENVSISEHICTELQVKVDIF